MIAIESPRPADPDDADVETTVYDLAIVPQAPATPSPVAQRSPTSAPESGVLARPPNAEPEPARDTVFAPPPWWRRLSARIDRGIVSFLDHLSGRHILTHELPPVPRSRPRTGTLVGSAECDAEYGEQLLLAILRAPVAYQDAAITLAKRALAVRQESEAAYHDLVVHCLLSRIRLDADGLIPIEWLREAALTMPRLGSLMKSLQRLEARGHVKLVLDTSGGDPMTELLRERITHIEVVVPV